MAVSVSSALGQRIAIFAPATTPQSTEFVDALATSLEDRFRVVDSGIALSAFNSVKVENPYNLTAESAKNIGTVIGSDHFVLIKAATQRRTSSAKPTYYEAYAAIFLVNSRTGLLELWHLESKQGDSPAEAEKLLFQAAPAIANVIASTVRAEKNHAESSPEFVLFDPDNKAMRPTMPYRRFKPEYTPTAFLYEIAATVEAEVSIDANGEIRRIDIVRWAGYGLDEAVIATIRKMNWRPGSRDGKPLPMRVLLRYNFTKIEKE
jgi:hypothetical protein